LQVRMDQAPQPNLALIMADDSMIDFELRETSDCIAETEGD